MKKTILSFTLMIVLLFSIASVYASAISSTSVINYANRIEETFKSIGKQLVMDYSDIYELEDFSYDYTERAEQGVIYVDMNIHCIMTLTRPSYESPFIQGMYEAISTASSRAEAELMQNEIDFYTEIIDSYFMVPEGATFTYSFSFDGNRTNTYYRHDTFDSVILIDVNDLKEVENPIAANQDGYEKAIEATTLNSSSFDSSGSQSRWVYNRITAKDWAHNNAYATPEYPSPTIPSGSDCANFVSKAINKGGVPSDSAGKWYQASPPGGYAGENWMRTGYNNNGGVKPYMTGKSYFYYQSNVSSVFAGSFMYWTNKSHVAFVTTGDTVTIKYAQHSPGGNNLVYRDANGTYVTNVQFYMPSASIM